MQEQIDQCVLGILQGDRFTLSRAITLLESTRADYRLAGQRILEQCLPNTGNSLRLGITGPPGAGKSSFIETFGIWLIEQHQKKVAVLAIDPSSQVSGGSILGDKTRMPRLSTHPSAFIRPSPASGALGGVAFTTRETLLLCEAAGYDLIMVETVGVGQSEIQVQGMVDFNLLLAIPGAGDELQGIKRGIVEIADLVLINKADGDRLEAAAQAMQAYDRALHLFPPKSGGWMPKAFTCSALRGEGMPQIWQQIEQFALQANASGWFAQNRREQSRRWLRELLEKSLLHLFYHRQGAREAMQAMEAAVISSQLSPAEAVRQLLQRFAPDLAAS
jgi:LAO/AO transport system kinase